jgi:hypothetical protein
VLATSPPAGTKLATGSTVALTLSAPRENWDIFVPSSRCSAPATPPTLTSHATRPRICASGLAGLSSWIGSSWSPTGPRLGAHCLSIGTQSGSCFSTSVVMGQFIAPRKHCDPNGDQLHYRHLQRHQREQRDVCRDGICHGNINCGDVDCRYRLYAGPGLEVEDSGLRESGILCRR